MTLGFIRNTYLVACMHKSGLRIDPSLHSRFALQPPAVAARCWSCCGRELPATSSTSAVGSMRVKKSASRRSSIDLFSVLLAKCCEASTDRSMPAKEATCRRGEYRTPVAALSGLLLSNRNLYLAEKTLTLLRPCFMKHKQSQCGSLALSGEASVPGCSTVRCRRILHSSLTSSVQVPNMVRNL